MFVREGMLVKDVLDELNKKYRVGFIGQPGKFVALTQRSILHDSGKNKKCFEVNEKTKFAAIAFICSASVKKPIKFINETVGVFLPAWSVKEYLHQLEKRCGNKPADKKSVVLKLIAAAEFFSDVDWILRVLKNSKILSEEVFIEQLYTAISNSSLPLDETQRLTLHSMLVKELLLNDENG